MFISTIIPTIGRATLSRAVESVLAQEHLSIDFEVIVVNDSGRPLPEANWQHSERVYVLQTWGRERSVARNTGAAVAKGRYLHFLDDDDWLAPGAYRHFWELSQSSSAKWLYGFTQLVDREARPLIQLRHGMKGNCFIQVMAGEWIPLQSSLIDRNMMMRVGGFNPLLTGPEDIDLLRRALLEAEIAELAYVVSYVAVGEQGSSTDYRKHPEASRWAREMVIDAPNAFERMWSSADSPYWYGRMLRVYLTSFVWNLRRWRFFCALSRLVFSCSCIMVAGGNIFSADFWRAVSRPYANATFRRGFQAAVQTG